MTERDRRDYIGGADVPALVMGEHYGSTPYTKWLVKTRRVDPPIVAGPDIDRGVALQQTALDMAMQAGDLPDTVYGDEVWVDGPEEWAAGHVDRLGVGWLGEAKCPRSHNYRRILADGPDMAHLLQIQYYLWITGCERGYLVYFCADSWEQTTHEIEASETVHEMIAEQCHAFWRCVQSDEAPDLPVLLDLGRALRCAHPKSAATADGDLLAIMERARDIEIEIEDRKRLSAELRDEMARLWPGTVRAVVAPGVGRLTYVSATTRRTIDASRLRAEYPEIAESMTVERDTAPSMRARWEAI